MGIVVIAEKKKLAIAIAEALGNTRNAGFSIKAGKNHEYQVMWCSGHILRLKNPTEYDKHSGGGWSFSMLPIFPEVMEYLPLDDKKKNIEAMKREVARADMVIHAGDPDREGQLIVDEVLDFLNYRGKVKRLLINDMNQPAVKRALISMQDNEAHRFRSDAGRARQCADWKFGMNLSPAFSLATGETVGIGRVQTPTLKMIIDRDHIIDGFGKLYYYNPSAHIIHENGSFDAEWVPVKGTPGMDDRSRILDEHVADDIANASSGAGKIIKLMERESTEKQPLGYSMSKMQIDAGRRFGMSSKKVMEICQSLYDIKGVATYPRASCVYLPDDHIELAPDVLDAITSILPDLQVWVDRADLSIRSAIWNQKEVDIASHHAMSPTAKVSSLTDDEMKIYRMLCERYLVQWLPEYKFIRRVIVAGNDKQHYTTSGQKPIELGWRGLFGFSASHKPISVELKQDDPVNIQAKVMRRETKPPPRFTDALIIDAMTNVHKLVSDPEMVKVLRRVKGIGTDATRDTIIERLMKHGLVERVSEKNKSVVRGTPKGRSLIATLEKAGAGAGMDPITTARWENLLDEIERGKITFDQFSEMQERFLLGMIEKAQGEAPETPHCPTCGGEMIKNKKFNFWGCAKYPKCKGTYDIDKDGDPCPRGSKSVVADENSPLCPKCGKPGVRRKGKYGDFYSCSGYPECREIIGKVENMKS